MITLDFGEHGKAQMPSPCSVVDGLISVNKELLKEYCAAKIDGKIVDLRMPVTEDTTFELVKIGTPEALKILRHTCAHIMAEAVKHLYPQAKVTIGPATDEGFFYDFECPPFDKEQLEEIEKEMKAIIKKNPRITRTEVSRNEARQMMQDMGETYKVELLDAIPEGERITLYTQDDFTDLCTGPHLLYVNQIKAFKLLASSNTYWRGDKNNHSLSRIHGTAFFTKEDLDAYLQHLEDIKNRDHNKLGREMELFTTVDVIGQGLPLLMPKGAKIIQTLQRWVEDLEDNQWGYTRTKTPLFAKSDLYKISGHWDHYRDGMFVIGDPDKEGDVFALRPMTCPFQYYVYKASPKSYRDLPCRYSETSTLFRNEDSGEMHGLTRVRQFTIAEGHLIVRPDQMVEEFKACLALAKYILTTLGLQEDVTYHLSKWDPNNRAKYIGEPEVWEKTQDSIREILVSLDIPFVEDDGEAAFYGPKVDINAKNVYGKEDTMITVQWDALLAYQYDMTYIDQNGESVRPYIIHRTSIGCYERTLAWLVEKYAGKLPVWLCPEQVRVLPISEKFFDYADSVATDLKKRGVLTEVDHRAEKIGRKIRDARNERIPYLIIVGQKEVEENTISLWSRFKGDEGSMTLNAFADRICEEIRMKEIRKESVEG